MINPKIVQKVSTLRCNQDEALLYLVGLYHHLSTETISYETKEAVRVSGIIDQTRHPDGTVEFKIPVYTASIYRTTKQDPNLSLSMTGTLTKDSVKDNSWIRTYFNLFPKQTQTGLTYNIRGTYISVETRMLNFIKSYKKYCEVSRPSNYQDLIIKATTLYLKQQKLKDWDYTKKAVKFIYDENGSMLATYIEKILQGQSIEGVAEDNFETHL